MAIRSRTARPDEWAAKVNHTHIIKDPYIQNFLGTCKFPSTSDEIGESEQEKILSLNENAENPVRYIVAVDGGYTVVEAKKSFPSAKLAFFQFGALLFETDDLDALSEKAFISTEDMKALQNLTRYKLAIPISNVLSSNQGSLTDSVRKAIYDFFMEQRESSSFMETLSWFIFQDYQQKPVDNYTLGSNPADSEGGAVILKKSEMSDKYTFDIDGATIYLTDVFRLHEAVDETTGAGGVLGYITRLIEQMILVHTIRLILKMSSTKLSDFLFIADGPLSFSGQTANMHKPMRALCNYLIKKHDLFLVGIEKSGPFVDHAREICKPSDGGPFLGKGKFILLDNSYIYRYVIPGDPSGPPYARTSYYGAKVIHHSFDGQVIVLTVPVATSEVVLAPKLSDFHNLEVILQNIRKLKCDMYDDSIVPIALANKLVSLANHPSRKLLEKFSTKSMGL
jgi:hypothetical protein